MALLMLTGPFMHRAGKSGEYIPGKELMSSKGSFVAAVRAPDWLCKAAVTAAST